MIYPIVCNISSLQHHVYILECQRNRSGDTYLHVCRIASDSHKKHDEHVVRTSFPLQTPLTQRMKRYQTLPPPTRLCRYSYKATECWFTIWLAVLNVDWGLYKWFIFRTTMQQPGSIKWSTFFNAVLQRVKPRASSLALCHVIGISHVAGARTKVGWGPMWGLHEHHQSTKAFQPLAVLASYAGVLTATQAVDDESHQL